MTKRRTDVQKRADITNALFSINCGQKLWPFFLPSYNSWSRTSLTLFSHHSLIHVESVAFLSSNHNSWRHTYIANALLLPQKCDNFFFFWT
jgi:hypothetical protein